MLHCSNWCMHVCNACMYVSMHFVYGILLCSLLTFLLIWCSIWIYVTVIVWFVATTCCISRIFHVFFIFIIVFAFCIFFSSYSFLAAVLLLTVATSQFNGVVVPFWWPWNKYDDDDDDDSKLHVLLSRFSNKLSLADFSTVPLEWFVSDIPWSTESLIGPVATIGTSCARAKLPINNPMRQSAWIPAHLPGMRLTDWLVSWLNYRSHYTVSSKRVPL